MNVEPFPNKINENKSYNRIAILGGRFSGKKTILNRFFLTEGKIYSTNYSLIKEFEYFLVEKPLWEKYSEWYDAMNDYFIENCSIIIYVVRTYTYEEQKKIQNLLQKFKDINKKIIVIHNIVGSEIKKNDYLDAGKHVTLKVRVEYDYSDITDESELPAENATLNLKYSMTYIQR